ncbi:MAG: hypothetical protein M0037_12035 [Betaproteobacteria bacterium]|nr:hypothetical protein [Betaproteobacteria bacterium]
MSSQINLFDPRLRPPRKFFSTAAMATALGALFLVLAMIYGAERHETTRLQTAMARSTGALASVQTRLARLAARLPEDPREQVGHPGAHAVGVALNAGRGGYAPYLAMFARHKLAGLSITGITIVGADHEMTIRGTAASAALVPRYLRELGKDALMHGACFALLDLHRPRTGPALPGRRAPDVVFELRTTPGAE